MINPNLNGSSRKMIPIVNVVFHMTLGRVLEIHLFSLSPTYLEKTPRVGGLGGG